MVGDGSKTAHNALIEATVKRLLNSDESELRILDICEETGVSTSVLYAHFHSRQGLVDAAMLALYREISAAVLSQVHLAIDAAPAAGGFIPALFQLLGDPTHQEELRWVRSIHLRVCAAALSRSSLVRDVAELQNAFHDRLAQVLGRLMSEGLLSSNLSARQWAIFFEGQMLSQASQDVRPGITQLGDYRRIAELVNHVDAAVRENA